MASRKKYLCLMTAVLISSAAGCSGSGGPIAFENYCNEYVSVTCNAAEKCGCLERYTIEMCRMVMRSDCQDEVETPVSSGKMSYDAAEAGRCLGGIKSAIDDCSLEGDDDPDACDRMLVGTVPAGQACGGYGECRTGLECHDGVCTAMPGAGQPCLDGHECAGDLYCGGDSLCHPYGGPGGDCSEGSSVCGDNLYCDSRSYTCQPPLGAGESCAHASYACGDDLYCSTATQTCRPYPSSSESCADSGGSCAEDLYCDYADSICKPEQPGGASCTSDEQCLSYDCADSFCAEDTEGACPFL